MLYPIGMFLLLGWLIGCIITMASQNKYALYVTSLVGLALMIAAIASMHWQIILLTGMWIVATWCCWKPWKGVKF